MSTSLGSILDALGLDATTPPDATTWKAFLDRIKPALEEEKSAAASAAPQPMADVGSKFAREEWSQLLWHHPEPILVSVDDKITYANVASAEVFGAASPTELIGHSVFDFVAPEHHEEVFARKAQLEAGQRTKPYEHRITRLDGEERFIQSYSRPVRYAGDPAAYTVIHDVTAQRRAEQALRESEERFRRMFERHSAPMMLIDPQTGAIVDANQSAAQFYGYKEAQLRTLHIQDINQTDPEAVREHRQAALNEEQNCFTFRHQLHDGSVRTVEVHSAPVEASGQTLLFSIVHDITEQRAAEDQLRYRANLERLIARLSTRFISASAEGVDDQIERALADLGRFIGVGRSYVFLLRGEGPLEHRMMDNTHEWCAPGVASQQDELQDVPCAAVGWWMDQLEQRGEVNISDVAALPSEAAPERELLEAQDIEALVAVPMAWEGELVGFVGFDVIDETTVLPENASTLLQVVGDIFVNALKQRETNLALRESEVRHRTLAEHTADIISRHERNGAFAYVSPAARELTGYAPGELQQLNPRSIIHPEDLQRVVRARERAVAGERVKFEFRLRQKNGTYRWVETSGQGIVDPQTGAFQGIVAATRDLTERKATEQALRRARTEAEAANQAKSAFLANISHEVRTPLNGVIGMASLLTETPLSDPQRQYVDTIRTSSETLLSLIDDILDFSKIEAERVELEARPFDLYPCLREALDMVAAQAADKGVELGMYVAPSVPTRVVGDEARLKQVLLNLMSNAIKFTHEGGVVLTASASDCEDAAGEAPRTRLEIAVHDSGIGIPDDRCDALFEPFTQTDASTTREYGGTGLGLAISRRLMELMGGTITVESEEGIGSTFTIAWEMPVEPTEERPPFRQSPAEAVASARLLIAEPHGATAEVLRRTATDWGMQVVCVTTPAELDAALAEEGSAFDAVLADATAPEVGEVLAAAQATASNPPRILLCTALGHSTGSLPETLSAAAVLRKPVTPDALYRALSDEAPAGGRGINGRMGADQHDFSGLRILLAEDNAVNQHIIDHMIARLGCQLEIVTTGTAVLEALDRSTYDAVFMDVQMPEMDGLEAARTIQQSTPAAQRPVLIALTAGAIEADREQCLAAGMDAYLRKPIRFADLRATLADLPRPAGDPHAPIDPDALEQLAADVGLDLDDPAFHRRFVVGYLDDVAGYLQQIERGVDNRDAEAVRKGGHALKGSSVALGATAVVRHCEAIQQAAQASDWDALCPLVGVLREALADVRAELMALPD